VAGTRSNGGRVVSDDPPAREVEPPIGHIRYEIQKKKNPPKNKSNKKNQTFYATDGYRTREKKKKIQ